MFTTCFIVIYEILYYIYSFIFNMDKLNQADQKGT